MQREIRVTKDYFIDYVDTSAKPRSCQPLNVVIKHVTIDGNEPKLTAAELAKILTMDAEDKSSMTIEDNTRHKQC